MDITGLFSTLGDSERGRNRLSVKIGDCESSVCDVLCTVTIDFQHGLCERSVQKHVVRLLAYCKVLAWGSLLVDERATNDTKHCSEQKKQAESLWYPGYSIPHRSLRLATQLHFRVGMFLLCQLLTQGSVYLKTYIVSRPCYWYCTRTCTTPSGIRMLIVSHGLRSFSGFFQKMIP